jgi:hypothetical protein
VLSCSLLDDVLTLVLISELFGVVPTGVVGVKGRLRIVLLALLSGFNREYESLLLAGDENASSIP